MANSLYEQMTDDSIALLAQMLGFHYTGINDMRACGFRVALREVPPIDQPSFTMGAALDAYIAHLTACRKPAPPDDAITALMDADWKLPAATRTGAH